MTLLLPLFMMRRMFVLYEAALYLVLVLTLPYFLIVGFLRGKYLPNLRERLGRYRSGRTPHDVWFHAVSVGEALALRPVLESVRARRPETTFVVTTTTITGQALAGRLFPEVDLTYFPLDFTFAVRRFLDHHTPRVFATMETEIWPNTLRLSSRRRVHLLLANGRISDRSYPRYRTFRRLLRPILSLYQRILVREEIDRDRFLEIGAPADRIEVVGNVKFDVPENGGESDAAPIVRLLSSGKPVFIAGSTIEGEDEVLVPAFMALARDHGCFIVIAPRKPERFEIVAGLLAASGADFARRSELDANPRSTPADFLLLDSFGELAGLYRLASAAFVGGSLVDAGGHNPIEPAAAGCPVAFGPFMSNFREIANAFLQSGGAVRVESIDELVGFARQMLLDPAARQSMAQRAAETVQRNRGAAARTADRILELLA